VLVLDDGFSWQGTHYASLSAVARRITGTPWSGPLFFGLKQNRPATQSPPQIASAPGEPRESSNAAALCVKILRKVTRVNAARGPQSLFSATADWHGLRT
jgi:hypothetical protein